MTDFDKLIKEKAEQADYAYKPSAWRNFQRHAGMSHGSLTYWVAGVSSAVVIGGLTTFLFLRNPNPTLGDEPSPRAVSVDTVSLTVDDQTAIVEEDTLSLSCSAEQKTPRSKAVPTAASQPDIEKPAAEANPPAKTSASPKKESPRYGRPLVIDVDTIKENVPTDEELKNGHSRIF